MLKTTMSAARRGLMAGLCAAVAGLAQAATVELYDGSFDVSTTVSNGTGAAVSNGGNLSYTLSFAQFDSSLGELTGVSIAYQGSLETSYSVARNGTGPNSAQQVTVTLDRTAGFGLAGGDTLGSVFDTFSTTYALVKNGSVSGAPSPVGTLVASDTWIASPSELAAFEGSGTFDLLAFADLTQTLTGPNGTSLQSSARWWGSAELVYTYTPFIGGSEPVVEQQQTPVPEPSVLLLAGIGLLALAANARRLR